MRMTARTMTTIPTIRPVCREERRRRVKNDYMNKRLSRIWNNISNEKENSFKSILSLIMILQNHDHGLSDN